MAANEARARIRINQLLAAAGWRFFDNSHGQANIQLEPNVKLTQQRIDALGQNFESVHNGYIDFLLLDEQGYPEIKTAVNQQQWQIAENLTRTRYENQPTLYLNLDKIRRSENLDRRIGHLA